MYTVCSEHLERAIDEFVEEFESPPDIHLLKEIHFTAWSAPAVCDYCKAEPQYLVI